MMLNPDPIGRALRQRRNPNLPPPASKPQSTRNKQPKSSQRLNRKNGLLQRMKLALALSSFIAIGALILTVNSYSVLENKNDVISKQAAEDYRLDLKPAKLRGGAMVAHRRNRHQITPKTEGDRILAARPTIKRKSVVAHLPLVKKSRTEPIITSKENRRNFEHNYEKKPAQKKNVIPTATIPTVFCLPTKKLVPLNDNYCDCPDGSDETETSACSNVTVQKDVFVCKDGSGTILFTSRVRDGIRDCMDGSDEEALLGSDAQPK